MGDILFIGGDRRMICAAELISQSGGVCAVGLGGDFPEPENQSGGYERIVLPVPFSRDGENITAPLSERPLPLELLTDYAAAGARIFSGGMLNDRILVANFEVKYRSCDTERIVPSN